MVIFFLILLDHYFVPLSFSELLQYGVEGNFRFFIIVICLFFIFIYSLKQFFIYILHTYFNFLVSIIRIFDNRYSFFFHPRLAAVQLHLQRLLKILYGPNILMMA